MTVGVFDALGNSTERAFEKLSAKGLSASQIVMALGPQFQQLLQYSQQFNIPLPPWLEKFMKQHPEIKFNVDPMQQVVTLLTKIADELDRIASPHPIGLTPPAGGWPKPPDYDPEDRHPTVPPPDTPGHAHGGTAYGPSSGHYELLHGTEGIVPSALFGQPIQFPSGGGFAQRLPRGGSGGTTVHHTQVGLAPGAITINPPAGMDPAAVARMVVGEFANSLTMRSAVQNIVRGR
jgi:DNA-binding transcriptional LysR family regulator